MVTRFATHHHASPAEFGMSALPCPFCASINVGVYVGNYHHMTCLACGAEGPMCTRDEPPQAAIERWNSRGAPESHRITYEGEWNR